MRNLYIFLLMSLPVCTNLLAVDLPPAATPGGAMPTEEFRYPQPFNYPKTAPVPEVEEKLQQVEKDAPRMRVKGFRITGVDENIEIGITQQSVEQLVKEVAEEMVATVASKGFSISMFEQITSAVARFYRQRGFFLARAYIPEQTVNDGIVQINIVEGFLDAVVFNGNSLYSNEQLQTAFDPLMGQSVYKPDVEEILFTLNDFPGLSTKMIFGPGLKSGSAAIQLKSVDEASHTRFSIDNFGSTYTGENRLRLNHQRNNMLGQADLLDLNLILTTSPTNSQYFDGSYQQPVINYRFNAGGGFSVNTFDVGGNLTDLGVNGESLDMHGFMQYLYRRDRTEKISTTAALHIKSSSSSAIASQFTDDKLTVLTLAGDYAGTSWSSSGTYQTANITLSIGFGESTETSPKFVVSDADFTKLSYIYSRLQRLSELQAVLFTFRGQHSSDKLTSLEKFSLGGPNTVRAYPVSEALMDTVYLFSAEYIAFASPDIKQTWLNKLRMSVFYDIATGELNDALPNEKSSVSFSGIGGSVQAEPYGKFELKLTMALDMGDEPSDNMSLPFFISMNYDF